MKPFIIAIFPVWVFISNVVKAHVADVSFTVTPTPVVHMVDVFSVSMQKQVRCMVLLPATYNVSGDPYPVLYLLHGWSGHHASWLKDAPQLPQLAEQRRMLIVCPDGGYDSWFIDSNVDSTVRYETFLTQELPAFIDYYYHTRAERTGRAIAGLSMGGHGALYIALKHPELFGKAASLAGGLDLRPFQKNDWDLKCVLGDPGTKWKNWEKASVSYLLDQPRPTYPELMIDCGTDDFFLSVNRDVHLKLKRQGVPHVYQERPGGHDAAYWGKTINLVIDWLW